MISILSIAAGGALGAVARHVVTVCAAGAFGFTFPWGTVIVNVAGSVLMGALIGLFAHVWQPAQEIRAFLTVGFLGAFTTFSAFSLEAVGLYERGELALSAAYIIGNVVLSIVGLLAGLSFMRMVAA